MPHRVFWAIAHAVVCRASGNPLQWLQECRQSDSTALPRGSATSWQGCDTGVWKSMHCWWAPQSEIRVMSKVWKTKAIARSDLLDMLRNSYAPHQQTQITPGEDHKLWALPSTLLGTPEDALESNFTGTWLYRCLGSIISETCLKEQGWGISLYKENLLSLLYIVSVVCLSTMVTISYSSCFWGQSREVPMMWLLTDTQSGLVYARSRSNNMESSKTS